MTTLEPARVDARTRRRAITAACIGNYIEYYDFVVYGYFAAVIAKLFFPSADPTASLLLAFAAFAVSYAARPLGAVVFSHIGDKYGRRTPLAVSVLMIAGATTLIGLMPTYASIGIAAPILLTVARMVQGIAVGGEYGGATSFVAEYAPEGRRGRYTGWIIFTIGLALLTGGAIAAMLTAMLPQEALLSWGWRLPFLIGLPLGLVGLYLRLRLQETPHFTEVREAAGKTGSPVVAGLRDWRTLLVGMGIAAAPAMCIYVFFIYSPTYLSTVLGHPAATALTVNMISLAFFCALILVFARLSDRVGRRPLMLAGTAAVVVVAYPAFLLLGADHLVPVTAGLCLLALALAPHAAVMLAALSETFPTTVRYTGLSLSLNIPTTLLGGTAPLIATALIASTGSRIAPVWLVIGAAIASFAAALASRDRSQEALASA